VVLLFTLVVALDTFGFQIARLVAGIGVAGLGIGIALQGVLSNVVAGLTIIFTKPFRVGEFISLLGVHGEVVAIELFSTTLVHPDRSHVVIPNRKIVGEILHNFHAMRQLTLTVRVPYDADLGAVISAARAVTVGHPRVRESCCAGPWGSKAFPSIACSGPWPRRSPPPGSRPCASTTRARETRPIEPKARFAGPPASTTCGRASAS
jgi:small conductance mechanosensitive channel